MTCHVMIGLVFSLIRRGCEYAIVKSVKGSVSSHSLVVVLAHRSSIKTNCAFYHAINFNPSDLMHLALLTRKPTLQPYHGPPLSFMAYKPRALLIPCNVLPLVLKEFYSPS